MQIRNLAPDMLLLNGRVYTLDGQNSVAQAVACLTVCCSVRVLEEACEPFQTMLTSDLLLTEAQERVFLVAGVVLFVTL